MNASRLNDEKTAAIGDLREFLRISEAKGELQVIEGADPHHEMGAIYELSLENLYPPVLLFKGIKGCDPSARVIMNVRTSKFMVGDLDLHAVRPVTRHEEDDNLGTFAAKSGRQIGTRSVGHHNVGQQ